MRSSWPIGRGTKRTAFSSLGRAKFGMVWGINKKTPPPRAISLIMAFHVLRYQSSDEYGYSYFHYTIGDACASPVSAPTSLSRLATESLSFRPPRRAEAFIGRGVEPSDRANSLRARLTLSRIGLLLVRFSNSSESHVRAPTDDGVFVPFSLLFFRRNRLDAPLSPTRALRVDAAFAMAAPASSTSTTSSR